jgi:hypothetical protein
LSAISQAQASRKQVGVWNASTNVPLLTSPPTTISGVTLNIGDYVEVSTAGTQFGISWAIGDIAKVVLSSNGVTLAWYKDPVQLDRFDSKNVWVSQATGSDTNSGSSFRPKQTLTGALAVAGQPGDISLVPGSYTATSLTISKTNISIFGRGANSNNSTEIVGGIITGAGRIRVKNVNFTNGSSNAFTWTDVTGSHHLEEVSITTGQSGAAFVVNATANGYATIASCDFSGSIAPSNIILNSLSNGLNCTTYITNVSGARLSVGANHVVYILACYDLQITQNLGSIVFLDNIYINKILKTQSELTTLLSDKNVATDGFYICDFSSPSVGSTGDVLLKKSVQSVATSIKVSIFYDKAPATLSVMVGSYTETIFKSSGRWLYVGSSVALYDSLVTSSTELSTWDKEYVVDSTNGSGLFTITLPPLPSSAAMLIIRRKDKTTRTIYVVPNTGYTINGYSTLTLHQGQTIKFRYEQAGDNFVFVECSERIPACCLLTKQAHGTVSTSGWTTIEFPSNASGFGVQDPSGIMWLASTPSGLNIMRSGTYEISAGFRTADNSLVSKTAIWLKVNGQNSGYDTWANNSGMTQNIVNATWTVTLWREQFISIHGIYESSTSGSLGISWAYFNAKTF